MFTVEDVFNIAPMGTRFHTSITTLDINEKTVFKKLTDFDISLLSGPDSIYPQILKESADSGTSYLEHNFMKCLYIILIYKPFIGKVIRL